MTTDMEPAKLKAICEGIVEDPRYAADKLPDGTFRTKCNLALIHVAEEFGIDLFRGKLADAIIGVARMSQNFLKADAETAAAHAVAGGFAFAGSTSDELSEKHGHVAVIAPIPCSESGSLKRAVPWIANVGMPNRTKVCLSSAAFPVKLNGRQFEATYYVYMGKGEA